jgi:hypothetical protein
MKKHLLGGFFGSRLGAGSELLEQVPSCGLGIAVLAVELEEADPVTDRNS